ncbi:MAG TPA: zf-HC2 domain-containing protein [Gemmatimonadaceae bacterium]|nr:zf-HC2 domain-containing protein [Gemmatimonadaceae bacterium]
MQHLDEGTIHSWLDGALGADEAARVEAHLAECRQCAAAVAEARGFIAASSRILTALDHLPRGVVPAAPPVKWHNRAVWRAAAAVLVVAVGGLVVVRDSEHKAGVHKIQPTTPITTSPSAISSRATFSGKPTADADFSGKSTSGAAQPSAVGRERALRNEAAATGGYAAAPSQIVGAMAATPQAAAPSRVAEVTTMDVASEQLPLKVIGTLRRIGANVTLYEVAPGDTVTLTELVSVQLEGVVVTGVSSSEPSRLAGKAAATALARRADAAVVSAPDSQRAERAVGAPAVSPSAAAPPSQMEVVNGVTTISWRDVATHNMLKLSGRMPVERLQEIKRRIERERAAAAAKKSP